MAVRSKHELTRVGRSSEQLLDDKFLCTCGVIGWQSEMDAHLAMVMREEVDALLASAWTIVCSAEERDYSRGEIEELSASCTAVAIKLKDLPAPTTNAVFVRLGIQRTMGSLIVERVAADSRRPNRVDKHRLDHGDYVRASGDVTCKVCGHVYYDHPVVVGFEWLHRACDGRLLKL